MNKFKVFGLYVLIVLTMFLVGGCCGSSDSPVTEQEYCEPYSVELPTANGDIKKITYKEPCPNNDCSRCDYLYRCDNGLYVEDKNACAICANGQWIFVYEDKTWKVKCRCDDLTLINSGVCCPSGGPAPENNAALCTENQCINGTLLSNGQCKCSNDVISAYGVCCPSGGPAPLGNLDYCGACDPSNPTCGYCDSNNNAKKCSDGRCCTDANCSNCTNSCDPDVPNCIVCDDNNKCLVCDSGALCTDKNCCNCPDGDSAKNDEVCDGDEPSETCIPGTTCLNGTCNNKGECVCGNGQPASKNAAGVDVCCPYTKNSLKATQGPAPEGNVEYCCANGQTPWYDANAGKTLDDARPETGCCPWKIGGKIVLYSASSGPADVSCASIDCSTDSNYCIDSKGNCIPGDCKQ